MKITISCEKCSQLNVITGKASWNEVQLVNLIRSFNCWKCGAQLEAKPVEYDRGGEVC